MTSVETLASLSLALPIADRRRAFDFYDAVLGLEPVGPPAADGLPEPLTLRVNAGLELVLIPRRGFGWVIGDHQVAEERRSECLLRVARGSEAAVRELVDRARDAGARVVTEPTQQPWGYEGAFADLDGHLWVVAVDRF